MNLTFSLVQPEDSIFSDAWNRELADHNPECSLHYLRALTACEPNRQHHYLLGRNEDGRAVAVAYFSVQTITFVLGLKVKVLILGGSMSANAHWIDTAADSYKNIMRAMLHFCAEHLKYHVVALKPFEAKNGELPLRSNSQDLGFINIYASTQSDIDLSGFVNYEDYTSTLDKKKRYYLRKIEKDAQIAGLRVEITEDFGRYISDMYPLYCAVAERASEIKEDDPLPPKYFEGLATLSMLNSKAILVRAGDGRIVGFLILMEQNAVLWCGPCGIEHASVKYFNTWYVLIYEAIKCGIRSQSKTIILGTTNYVMKRKFGATRLDLWISLRFRSHTLTQLLAPFIRFWIRRNVFGGDQSGTLGENAVGAS